MNKIKMIGLAVVAVFALMATVGAASASAGATLCSTNTSPCTGTQYGSGTKVTGQLAAGFDATLTTSIGNVTCLKSTVGGVLNNVEGHGEITSLTFTECKLGTTSCTVSAVNLPYTATAISTAATLGQGNGDLTISAKAGGGTPGASVVCGSFINCTFSNGDIILKVIGGNPAILHAESVELSRSGGICPSTSKWDATYEVTSPKPLFIEPLP